MIHLIVLSFGENLSNDMIQQLVLTIIRNSSEEVRQYLTGEEEIDSIPEDAELYAALELSANLSNRGTDPSNDRTNISNEGTDRSIEAMDQSNNGQNEEKNES